MDSGHSYYLPQALTNSVQELINTYNKQEEKAETKTETLKKIDTIVHNFLTQTSSQEAIQEVERLLTQVKVQSADKDLWNHIMGEIDDNKGQWNQITRGVNEVMEGIETDPSAISTRHLEILSCSPDLPLEVFWQIIEKMARAEVLIELLNKPTGFPPEKKFELALKCGKDLQALDLSEFTELDNDMLKKLQEACPNLQRLKLIGCYKITGQAFEHLKSLKHLTVLDLSETGISGSEGFEHLKNFDSLEYLNLSKTNIRNACAEHIKNIKNLKHLNLYMCEGFEVQGLQQLTGPVSLKSLDLGFSGVCHSSSFGNNNDYLVHLMAFPSLEVLSLDGLCIRDDAIEYLTRLTSLKRLNLNQNRLTDSGFKRLTTLSSLEALKLHCCPTIKSDTLQYFANFPSLQALNLSSCHFITDDGIKHLAAIPSLLFLNLGGCEQITDNGIKHLKALPSLLFLSLGGIEQQITDEALKDLADMTSLRSLDLSYCPNITDDGIKYLATLPSLIFLNLLPSLIFLNLKGCKKITEACLTFLQNNKNLDIQIDH